MKRLILIGIVILIVVYFSSCKSSEKCPAYGENQVEKIESKA